VSPRDNSWQGVAAYLGTRGLAPFKQNNNNNTIYNTSQPFPQNDKHVWPLFSNILVVHTRPAASITLPQSENRTGPSVGRAPAVVGWHYPVAMRTGLPMVSCKILGWDNNPYFGIGPSKGKFRISTMTWLLSYLQRRGHLLTFISFAFY
jgi:hypothetical protein